MKIPSSALLLQDKPPHYVLTWFCDSGNGRITTQWNLLSLLVNFHLFCILPSERWSCWGATCTTAFGQRRSAKVVFILPGLSRCVASLPRCVFSIDSSVFLQLWKWSEKSRVRHTRASPAVLDKTVRTQEFLHSFLFFVCFIDYLCGAQSAYSNFFFLFCFPESAQDQDDRCKTPEKKTFKQMFLLWR